jgi:hypothetical protein
VRRATWVWHSPVPSDLVTWARRHAVVEVFLAVRADFVARGRLSYVREVVRQADESGIRVTALGGDPLWVDRPDDAAAWMRAVAHVGLFDGVHLDVEPWARKDWDAHRARLVSGYLEVLSKTVELKLLPVAADLAFWLHQVPTASGEPLDAAAMQLVHAVTVLSYRTRATGQDSITAVAAAALETAQRNHIPCRLAVETLPLEADPDRTKQTFFGRGLPELERALAEVDRALAGNPSYDGMAVHDLDGWRAL